MRNTKYDVNDTIVAVSSPTSGGRVIVRISGPDTIRKINQIFRPLIHVNRGTRDEKQETSLVTGSVAIDKELKIDAKLYLFLAPYSYTGDDVAEIHIHTNASVTEALMESLLAKGLRMAGPGEFTARSFLNGKIDLAQAEAVNEIIVSSNRFQLAAAEKLLSGKLAQTTEKIRSELMDCLSLIEAGLDFSGEDIEFISRDEADEKLSGMQTELGQLLSDSISCESMLDLPAVGIAGAPGAGKSSLLNKLAGYERSIVSAQRKTTRDVLTCELSLRHCECVLFDCAGLIGVPARRGPIATAENILDELAQQAAIEALRNSSVVIFCADLSKEDWSEDLLIFDLIEPQIMIPVATKSDLLSGEMLTERIAELNKLFNADFLITSVKTGIGLEQLCYTIDKRLIEQVLGRGAEGQVAERASGVALTVRHRQAVTEAIENVSESINELKVGNDEVAAMMLRAAYQAISDIEQQHLDDEILERIFSRFCIGK
jgi:tRNA modification GTPase